MAVSFSTQQMAFVSRAKRFSCKKGQTLVEYVILLAFLAVVCIGIFALLQTQIMAIFSVITGELDTAQSPT